MDNVQLNKQLIKLILITLFSGLLWVLSAVFWIDIWVNRYTFGLLLYLCIIVFLIFSLVKSFIFAIKKIKLLKLKVLAPLGILLISLALVVSTDSVITDFYLRFKPHTQSVILALEKGNLAISPNQNFIKVDIDIPVAKAIYMTRDEKAMTIFFTRYTASFGDHSVGYTYYSDNRESQIHNPPSGTVHRKIEEHWFWGVDPFDPSLKATGILNMVAVNRFIPF